MSIPLQKIPNQNYSFNQNYNNSADCLMEQLIEVISKQEILKSRFSCQAVGYLIVNCVDMCEDTLMISDINKLVNLSTNSFA